MKRTAFQFILVVFLTLVVSSLAQTPVAQAIPTRTTIVVNSTSDNGPGSLREAIENALPGDSITFDLSVFPPTNPDTIALDSPLSALLQGNLVIDASDAGVVIDGSRITTSEAYCLSIFSNNNVIHGLQIMDFSQAGIGLNGGAQYNTIGGDRDVGEGPLGQGNLISGDGTFGIGLWSNGTSFNTIQGNFIGTDVSGTTLHGSLSGGIFSDGADYNLLVDNLIGGYMDNGVSIGSVSNGHNTVRGNYIGTNSSGMTVIANSEAFGISISGSGFNVIGPDNVIANNGDAGITVFGEESVDNRITQNSIYYNYGLGIELWDGGNTRLAAPVIFDFDKQAGLVTGAACANCTVEVFSDDGSEGGVYEGQTIADNAGIFSFNKDAPFTRTYISATTTDADGNTSQFSEYIPNIPTRTLILQDGNNLPKTQLQYKRSEELEKNRIGSFWDLVGPADDSSEWNSRMIFDLGLKYASILFNSKEGHTAIWDWPELSVTPAQDDHVNDLVANGVTLNFNLVFWDVANHPDGWEEPAGYSRFQPDNEEEIQRYLEYVQFMVNHLKDRVQYFELWNEPDNQGIPIQYIPVPDYIKLVKRVVPVIRQEYPDAKIVVGSVSNLIYNLDYLFDMVKSEEIMPLVDVIAWHPIYGQSPAEGHSPEYYSEYPSIVQAIKDTAFANGFRGEYRADELSYWIYPKADMPGMEHSAFHITKYHARSIMMHLGMDMAAILAGPGYKTFAFATIRNLCTVMAGATTDSVAIQIQSEATNIKSYSFSLPGGEKLIALWTNGVAVDDDPGITATLTLPGLSDQRMTGIDVLNGFQQEMITEVENGNLVIRNLMVKDYPIIMSSASIATSVTDNDGSPFTFALHQNYPNPFNPVTTIQYELPQRSDVQITIYDLLGRKVTTLLSETQDAGFKSVQWNATNVSSGMYFYQIKAGDYVQTRKMVVLK